MMETRCQTPAKVAGLRALATMALQTMEPSPAIARADADPLFQSPSGNVQCNMGSADGTTWAACEIHDRTWATPPRPTPCVGSFGNRISMSTGSAPEMTCHTDSLMGNGYPTLQYGQTRSLNSISCASELPGMACTDSSTGHYFRLSRDNYKLHRRRLPAPEEQVTK
jgi:hypothetical protein